MLYKSWWFLCTPKPWSSGTWPGSRLHPSPPVLRSARCHLQALEELWAFSTILTSSKKHSKRQIPARFFQGIFYFQTFLLQKFKLMFWLQRSQHKAHFLINKWTPFTQAPQKYTKVLSLEQFSWNVFTLVFSTMLVFPGFHMGQISCVLCFQRQSKVPWEVNSVFSYRKKYLLYLSFIETEKYTLSPLKQRGYTEVCMLCDVCVKWNTFETHNRRFLGVYLNKNPETSLKPRISHVKCWNCNQNMNC